MRSLNAVLSVALVLSFSAAAQAQTRPTTAPSTSAEEVVVVQPPAPVPTVVAPVATQPGGAGGTCALGVHDGIDDSDAGTVQQLVCEEIRRHVQGNAYSYVVEIRRLGRARILSVQELDSSGRVIDRKQAVLANLEEAIVAAPRLVQSLVGRQGLEASQQVDNILAQESRTLRKKSGTTHFGLGILGTAYPGSSGLIAPGLDLAVYHEGKSFAVGGDFRVGSRSEGAEYSGDGKEMSFYALSVGGRYFPWSTDTTPYFGGGLSWTGMKIQDSELSLSGSGVGVFLEGGVEALRTYHTHLLFGIRATLPLFMLKDSGYHFSYDSNGYQSSMPSATRKFAVPLSLNATVLF